jgi:DNA-binding NtrC family response regulator
MANPRNGDKTLLWILELGGYPDFSELYRRAGYRVEVARSTRKALSLLKTLHPAAIVAEFNYDPAFRDRISNLDSLLANVQRLPGTRVIVLYEKDVIDQLERLRARFPNFTALPFPVDSEALEAALASG